MEVLFERARPEDYDDVIDIGNYVFSHAYAPHDEPTMLPKLHKRECFMDGIHYIAREGGRIKAVVGAYPLEWEFLGENQNVITLPGRGIGMVTVHPYSRSRGFMKELMNMALDDMKRDDVVFSCLSGRRQRYEYFGFCPAGSLYTFTCNENNIRHTLGPQWNSGLSLKPVGPGDEALLDQIHAFHEAKAARIRRPRKIFFDILSSWKAKTFAVISGDRFEGYFISKGGKNGEHNIIEINLHDFSRLPEILGLFLRQGTNAQDPDSSCYARVTANPHEREKITALAGFAESYTLGHAYHFAIFDYRRFAEPFLKLASRDRKLADGSFAFQIEGGPRLRLAVEQGAASLSETTDTSEHSSGGLSLKPLEATRFLFSPLAPQTFPAIRESLFLQSLLPLPLFFENVDGI